MNKHIGSSFDSFLEEEDILAETSAEALKRVLAWQIKNFLDTNHITKATLVNTANAMGKHIEINIAD